MTSPSSVPLEQFATLFPFLLCFDRERRVVCIGRSLQRVVPEMRAGDDVSRHLSISRPRVSWNDESFLGLTNTVFTLVVHGREPMPLKGQLVPTGNGTQFLFLLRPAIAGAEDMARYGLSAADFSVHDPLLDYLFLLQAQRTTMEELRTATHALEVEREELRAANLELELLRKVSNILTLARLDSATDAMCSITAAVCEAQGWESSVAWIRAAEAPE